MSITSSSQLELLRAKLALAIGPIEINLVYDEVKAAHPNALNEPWSSDMSGPHKHIVFNNKTFVLSEVADEQLASALARVNDPWQLEIFQMMGLDMEAIHCPVTGRDPMGSFYYSLIKSVNGCILKKVSSENRTKEDGNLRTRDVVMGEQADEAKEEEGAEEETVSGDAHADAVMEGGEANERKFFWS
ncbi:MAG: hypothetical protein Q9175_004004 [Cornicularia normoerica]